MSMKKVEFVRIGRFIQDANGNPAQEFKSISAAKRWSRDWQKANGGLGIGKLRVV